MVIDWITLYQINWTSPHPRPPPQLWLFRLAIEYFISLHFSRFFSRVRRRRLLLHVLLLLLLHFFTVFLPLITDDNFSHPLSLFLTGERVTLFHSFQKTVSHR